MYHTDFSTFTVEKPNLHMVLEGTTDQHIERFKQRLDPAGKKSFESIPMEYQRRLVAIDRMTPQQQINLMRTILQARILAVMHLLCDDMAVLMLLTRRHEYHRFFLRILESNQMSKA